MQTDVYIKIINEKMNMEFWMAGFLVIPKVYAVIASPFSFWSNWHLDTLSTSKWPLEPQVCQIFSYNSEKNEQKGS